MNEKEEDRGVSRLLLKRWLGVRLPLKLALTVLVDGLGQLPASYLPDSLPPGSLGGRYLEAPSQTSLQLYSVSHKVRRAKFFRTNCSEKNAGSN